jgi:hypothetical protein
MLTSQIISKMITGEDIGKRVIYWNPNIRKWEPCDWIIEAIDTSACIAYMISHTGRTFKWSLKMIIPIDTP